MIIVVVHFIGGTGSLHPEPVSDYRGVQEFAAAYCTYG